MFFSEGGVIGSYILPCATLKSPSLNMKCINFKVFQDFKMPWTASKRHLLRSEWKKSDLRGEKIQQKRSMEFRQIKVKWGGDNRDDQSLIVVQFPTPLSIHLLYTSCSILNEINSLWVVYQIQHSDWSIEMLNHNTPFWHISIGQ